MTPTKTKYLSFSLGPVQDFVAAARTTRDLWTGSFLLSWLTGHAIQVVGAENLVLPSVSQGDSILQAISLSTSRNDVRINPLDQGVWVPTIPNTFVAEVDDSFEVSSIHNAIKEEWQRIASSVREHLQRRVKFESVDPWIFWDEQINNYWDIHALAIDKQRAVESANQLVPQAANDLQRGLKYLGKVAGFHKQVRKFPPHEVYRSQFSDELREDTRPKCSMFGSMAQMGPLVGSCEPQMQRIADFWKNCVETTSIEGGRLQLKDRLCAVALVKRFAYACYFRNRFGAGAELKFPDIDTICARNWIDHTELTCNESNNEEWSGRWLRWNSREEGREEGEPCPSEETWRAIEAAKKAMSGIPAYYAALMLDGDKMGDTLNRCTTLDDYKQVSAELGRFASQNAQSIVEEQFKGKLVYAGGDDVLALLPADNALNCARSLREAFGNLTFPNSNEHPPCCTVAIVVAHHKHPLHAVLTKLRSTERIGKQAGGDCLALTVARRSGEEATNVIRWGNQVESLATFVDWFRSNPNAPQENGETDRWVYRFRQSLSNLGDDVSEIVRLCHRTELDRLLSRAQLKGSSDVGSQAADSRRTKFLKFYDDLLNSDDSPCKHSERFSQLIQSASFIARNGDQ